MILYTHVPLTQHNTAQEQWHAVSSLECVCVCVCVEEGGTSIHGTSSFSCVHCTHILFTTLPPCTVSYLNTSKHVMTLNSNSLESNF